ncbi:DUF2637 domain-containing protein [Streptomyces mayteni]
MNITVNSVLEQLSTLPAWVMPVLATVGLGLAVALVLWMRNTARSWVSGIGPQAIVALGGVAVSVYGLWGFAIDTAKLPAVLAIAFIAVFDAAEMVLLMMLYRAADPAKGWTPQLRLMHRTAWMLVSFSCSMNAVHAPNWWSRPVLAAIPALATWLIELQLREKLGQHVAADDEQRVGRPGPVRLVVVVWQHFWARLFAAFGFDARAQGSEVARAAMARRAAHRVYRLRLILPPGNPEPTGWWDRRKLRRAQAALDRADIATDPAQGLAFARRMAGLTGTVNVAAANYQDAPAVMTLLESLSVTAAADRITAQSGAMEAEAARQRAEDARQRAETARQRAVEETDAARTVLGELETQRVQAEETAADATRRAENARQEAERAETARDRAEAARQRAEDDATTADRRARQLADEADLSKERLERTTQELHRLEDQTTTARQGQHGTQDQLATLRRQLGDLKDQHDKADQAARQAAQQARDTRAAVDAVRQELAGLHTARDQALTAQADAREAARRAQIEAQGAAERAAAQQRQAREISGLLERLRGELADQVGDGPVPVPGRRLFESDAKQAGWEHYRAEVSANRAEPSAAELAEQFGVVAGNARNWLRDFRAARARELAQPVARHESVNGTPISV